jgi:hypothetical protein
MALCPFCRKGATFCQGAGQIGHISHAEAMEMPLRRHKGWRLVNPAVIKRLPESS